MDEIYIVIGKRISKKRKELHLSQENLVEMAKMNRNSVSNIERAERRVTLENLQKITAALNLTFEELFRGF